MKNDNSRVKKVEHIVTYIMYCTSKYTTIIMRKSVGETGAAWDKKFEIGF